MGDMNTAALSMLPEFDIAESTFLVILPPEADTKVTLTKKN